MPPAHLLAKRQANAPVRGICALRVSHLAISDGIVTFRPGIPIAVDGVPVDLLSADEALEEEIDEPAQTEGIPIVEVEALVLLKLRAHRRVDKVDIVELLKAGTPDKPIRAYLRDLAPELVDRFDALVESAEQED